jgi:hypothetical protein
MSSKGMYEVVGFRIFQRCVVYEIGVGYCLFRKGMINIAKR